MRSRREELTECRGDLECAAASSRAGMSIGHGHLVHIARASAGWTAALNPENWTVFNFDKAGEAGAAAHELGREQALLARIVGDGDRYYRGHEGGFDADEILRVAETIDGLAGARFGGVTTFPALLFDAASGSVRPTRIWAPCSVQWSLSSSVDATACR